jgi:hypothetical protein
MEQENSTAKINIKLPTPSCAEHMPKYVKSFSIRLAPKAKTKSKTKTPWTSCAP